MSQIVETAVKLRRDGHKVLIVSSGGIAVGLKRLKLTQRPKHLSSVQAVAAIGQARLIGLWDDLFRQLDQPIAQILLTRNDIADRTQYLNAANTMNELLNMGVIPIVNENDTLSVSEIRFGDNDTLSAITAGMVNANYLFLMTDVDCLYTENPRTNPEAKPILVVDDISKLKVDVSSGAGSNVGTGGMTTKLIAARLATSAGVNTIICKSSIPGNIHLIVKYIQTHDTPSVEVIADKIPTAISSASASHTSLTETPEIQQHELESLTIEDVPLHTRFLPIGQPIKDRQFWILHGLSPSGSIFIDQGASSALTRSNRAGLLPVGIINVDGIFHTSECVNIYSAHRSSDGVGMDKSKPSKLIGKALVNYSSTELDRIKGLHSHEIESAIGYADSEYAAFRDNMAFF
ncbi:glutamate 5-kinase [Sugiyamaella lignohabitans]|uniref:Glutamate 5-kinase n=1 Tax=Sugiyamaella lignohabitans TaxID=796027 RepID=A0A167FGF0_9ASCO|nr:glutamate 5-kinase [Sugiyamaella lignohabitans]ANB15268.1 glutamate 5-kinase [Sugiyamaella lignohabitans]